MPSYYWKISYTDSRDPCCPVFKMTFVAEDSAWAEQKFWDTCHETDFDWRILEVTNLGPVTK